MMGSFIIGLVVGYFIRSLSDNEDKDDVEDVIKDEWEVPVRHQSEDEENKPRRS